MSTSPNRSRVSLGVTLTVAAGVVLAMALAAAFAAAPASAGDSHFTVASGSDDQWAFGGNASATYSCSGAACGAGSNITSLSIHYYVEWVVIYSATPISASQTEYEATAAINASVGVSVAGCVSMGATCAPISASANVAGRETASGFTNITNTGTVNLTAGPDAPATVAALAALNAQSSAAFNFSGSYTEDLTVNGTSETASINFDFGGNEATSVTFGSPLGIVPINPLPGQWWTASAPYSATGSYTSGYTLSETANGVSHSASDWHGITVSPSGVLDVEGTDLGNFTLQDNYTSPPTTVSASEVLLTFSNGAFTGTDGWLIIPAGLYSGASGALNATGSVGLIAGNHPSQSVTESSGESAYYQSGTGFIGGSEAVNDSALGGTGGPEFTLNAGPEPVSVAQQQYQAITASPGSSNFPWVWLVAGVVVVLVVVVVVTLVALRSRRRQPPATAMAPLGANPPGNPPS
jgi:hypothetical protein